MVLAGGANRRFGGVPKGLEIVGGSRMIDRVATALRGLTGDVALAANDADAHRWLPGAVVLTDAHPGTGGLAGVEAALRLGESEGRDVIAVAWDMPFVTHDVLRLIADKVPGADVVLPESESPYGVEPFCAYYSTRVLDALTAFLQTGGGAAREFLAGTPRVQRVPIAEIRRLGDPRRIFFSVNSPADLRRARAMDAGAE